MSFFDRFKTVPSVETKSAEPVSATSQSIVAAYEDRDQWDMSFALLNEYTKRCAPLASSMNEISDAGCEVPARLWNIKTEKYINGHKLLDLLAFPNSGITYSNFMRSLIFNYCSSGNPFLRIMGSHKREPISLSIDQPRFVNIEADRDGDVSAIKIQNDFGARTYKPDTVDGRTRMRRNDDDEIWHIKSFNPDEGTRKFFGAPLARPLYNDIEMYIFGGKHNKSMLKRGARPSGTITIANDDMMSDDDWDATKQRIREQVVGIMNSGNVLVMQNGQFVPLSINNKDMDYKELINMSTVSIFRHFKIPLPLVLSDTMTMGNYATAQVSLYDRAVLPVVRFIFEQLWCALMYRFEPKNWRDYRLVFDEDDISALVTRRIENMSKMSTAGVFTINEIRDASGYKKISGGDDVWRSTNEAPILERPADGTQEEDNEGNRTDTDNDGE